MKNGMCKQGVRPPYQLYGFEVCQINKIKEQLTIAGQTKTSHDPEFSSSVVSLS